MVELLANLCRDAQFGLVMSLGAGGVPVALLNEAETLLLPASKADTAAALQRLQHYRSLTGYRGGAAADIPHLAGALAKLALAFAAQSTTLAAKAINPLFVCTNGNWVVDALVQIREE